MSSPQPSRAPRVSGAQLAAIRRSKHAKRARALGLTAAPVAGDPISLRGEVARVFHASPSWSAASIVPFGPDGSRLPAVSAAGAYYAREGEHIALAGRWKEDPRFGLQIAVETASYQTPADAGALTAYLSRNPAFRGIGPTRAAKLAARYGSAVALAEAMRERPAEAAKVSGASRAVIEAASAAWTEREATNEAAAFLAGFGLTNHQQEMLLGAFGATIVAALREDPYLLLGKIERFGFKRLDLIARKLGVPPLLPARLREGLLHVLREEAERGGHTWTARAALIEAAMRLLEMDALDSRERLSAALGELQAAGRVFVGAAGAAAVGPDSGLTAGDAPCALPHLRAAESEIVAALRGAYAPSPAFPGMTQERASALVEEFAPGLNAGQRSAVEMVLTHAISVVTGGAGVGKTFTVGALLAICEALDVSVTMAAPTGKAARRMAEVSGRPAKTLHRLLGYRGAKFALDEWLEEHNHTAPPCDSERWNRDAYPSAPWIDADLVIVDEMSMVDAALFAQLLRVIDRRKTALLLVGDHNQLMPVGPGAPLRDILATHAAPATVLEEVVRQAGVLKANCHALLQGQVAPSQMRRARRAVRSGVEAFAGAASSVPPAQAGAGAGDDDDSWFVLSPSSMKEPAAAAAAVVDLAVRLVPERLGFDPIADLQVLTPMHRGAVGTIELNAALQRAIQRTRFGFDVDAENEPAVPVAPVGPDSPGAASDQASAKRPPVRFYAGDKVIQCRNDYDIDVMNGTIGYVRWVGALGRRPLVVVEFDERFFLYTPGGDALSSFRAGGAEVIPQPFRDAVDTETPGTLRDLQFAYAITPHRDQGSEHPCVIVVVHKSQTIMHDRTLFYTACTRAKRTVLIVGDAWAIRNCAKQASAAARRTWIPLLLSGLRR